MEMFAKTGGLNLPHDYWYLISIYGDDLPYVDDKLTVLKDMGCVKACSLLFWDITAKMIDSLKEKFPHAVLFDEGHAKKIIAFLDNANKDPKDSDLVVHCSAGISRSGAVGTFACDYFGLDYNSLNDKSTWVENCTIVGITKDDYITTVLLFSGKR